MSKIYFTITGTKYRYGQDFLKPGMKVRLVKEPDNAYDREAIQVKLKGLGHIGYVANSPYTVEGESWSAGRLYDKIGKKAKGTVLWILPKGVICSLDSKSLPSRCIKEEVNEQIKEKSGKESAGIQSKEKAEGLNSEELLILDEPDQEAKNPAAA